MPRQARLDAPGTLHHGMVRGVEKHRIVDAGKDRATFITRLGAAASTGMGIYAWALLPNHAHILFRLTGAGGRGSGWWTGSVRRGGFPLKSCSRGAGGSRYRG